MRNENIDENKLNYLDSYPHDDNSNNYNKS